MSEEAVSEEPAAEEGAPAWMATFADMMTLLLCFFVLLLSFAQTDVVKFKEVLGSVKDALGVPLPVSGVWAVRANNLIEISPSESSPRIQVMVPVPKPNQSDQELKEKVDRFIDERRLTGIVEAVPGERGVTIRVKGTLMFNPGSDELRVGSTPILEEIADLAAAFDYNVGVEGHTDDTPIRAGRFRSNWELSAARAVAGLRYLLETGKLDPHRGSATAFAHTRPVSDEKNAQARALNRRLEFVFSRGDPVGADGRQDRTLRDAAGRAAGSFAR